MGPVRALFSSFRLLLSEKQLTSGKPSKLGMSLAGKIRALFANLRIFSFSEPPRNAIWFGYKVENWGMAQHFRTAISSLVRCKITKQLLAEAGTRTRDRWFPPEPINLYIKKWYIHDELCYGLTEKNLAASSVGHFLSKAPITNKRVVTRRIVFGTKDARSVRILPRCHKFISIISREHMQLSR